MADGEEYQNNILKFMALGRLAKGSSGGAVMARELDGAGGEERKTLGKHQVLAYCAASKDERTKIYKKHVKELMSKGAARLTGGKRVRLLSDEEEDGSKYELHILTEYIDNDPNQALVFFAITSLDFSKQQNVTALFKDFKNGVYEQFDSDALASAQSSGPVHSTLKGFFESLFRKYNNSALANVSMKVEQVKETMKNNVNKALNNVEQLEEMEVKAESMENQAKLFEKRGGQVLWLMRCRYIKITALIGVIVLSLLAYLIFYIYTQTHRFDGPAPTPLPQTTAPPPVVTEYPTPSGPTTLAP